MVPYMLFTHTTSRRAAKRMPLAAGPASASSRSSPFNTLMPTPLPRLSSLTRYIASCPRITIKVL